MRYALWALGAWMLVGVGLQTGAFKVAYDYATQVASVFFIDSSTPDMLHKAYAAAQKKKGRPVSILIVPGHDQAASGTSYNGLSEAELTLATAQKLQALFGDDSRVETSLTRTDGWYIPELAAFFSTHRSDIFAYRADQTNLMNRLVTLGQVTTDIIVDHNVAPSEVALRLYGINLWANQHNVDAILHIHYNDVPRQNRAKPAPYTGFAIYIPEHQYSNYKGSLALAQAIKARLLEHEHASTLPGESGGIIEDQGLIATGSHNSVDASAVLVECAYIYEPQLQTAAGLDAAESSCASAIYQGMKDFFTGDKLSVR